GRGRQDSRTGVQGRHEAAARFRRGENRSRTDDGRRGGEGRAVGLASARRPRFARPCDAERRGSSAIGVLGEWLGRDLDRKSTRVRRQRFEGKFVWPSGWMLVHIV